MMQGLETRFQSVMNTTADSPTLNGIHNNNNVPYDEDTRDQPVDYSKKYTERNGPPQNSIFDSSQRERLSKKEFSDHNSKVDLFGDYAETDLDQPTDYSLRYAEDDTDEVEKESPNYFTGSEQEDTVKTYCTEGTPYETPFNFSTATSMSDLRVEESKDNDNSKKNIRKAGELRQRDPFLKPRAVQCIDEQPLLTKEEKNKKNLLTPVMGIVAPEKPVNYYVEGTPDCFSRVSSSSSLNSATAAQGNIVTDIVTDTPLNGNIEVTTSERSNQNITMCENIERISAENNRSQDIKNDSRTMDKEGKVVTFGGEDRYSEQTPLMFSRCSSLGSLSGFEQHSIHDDRSSVISDFSRRTSGIVSPSELPDSPTQTVPPSPRHHKTHSVNFTGRTQDEVPRLPHRHLSSNKPALKRSVFEDDIASFKEESTPIEFSAATSLSSLTIDDEHKVASDPKNLENFHHGTECQIKESDESPTNPQIGQAEAEKDQDEVSDVDEDGEDILAACINMGMQHNRYRQSFKKSHLHKSPNSVPISNLIRYQTSSALNQLEGANSSIGEKTSPIRKLKATLEAGTFPDTVRIYCTENTPADISPEGSQSNLSALSMGSSSSDIRSVGQGDLLKNESHRNELSDDSSNLSGDDDILDECIQSGMPKIRHTPPPLLNCIPIVKKTEMLPQLFHLYGTPSTSPVDATQSAKTTLIEKTGEFRTIETRNDVSDDSPNLSDDEAILRECIESAMPKGRAHTPSVSKPSSTKGADIILDRSSIHPSSPLPLRRILHNSSSSTIIPTRSELVDEDSSLSEEEDIILARCIRSGMPKALNVPSPMLSSQVSRKSEFHLQRSNSLGSAGLLIQNKTHSSDPETLQKQLLLSPRRMKASCPATHGIESNFSLLSDNSSSRNIMNNMVDLNSPIEQFHAHRLGRSDKTPGISNEKSAECPNIRDLTSDGYSTEGPT
ncbi:adenomatous polyposis coli protein-like [Orussus abietinus]|uniref:adenomatous polyposis coli protein-like n=1 Tax=Orussus abietinus TaxID=222816 RepID=UPI000C715D13|nr:adenomatous polyposis coli protein-like [Orussus abietinus]